MIDFKKFRQANKMTQASAGDYFGCGQAFISQIENGIRPVPGEYISKALADSNLDSGWLMDNTPKEGSNVQFYDPEDIPRGERLIPFYDDISSIGGHNGIVANMEGQSQPTEFIRPGDWFKNATAAIRNYGDSMVEYPPGCILVLKEVFDHRLIIPGRDYVIETSEYRITKRAHANTHDYLRVRSTNEEKYEDGELIHQPFNIEWQCITKISEVIAHIVKRGSGTEVLFSNQKK